MSTKSIIILVVATLVGFAAVFARGIPYETRFATRVGVPSTVEMRWRATPESQSQSINPEEWDWQDLGQEIPEPAPICWSAEFDVPGQGYFEMRYWTEDRPDPSPWFLPRSVPEPPLPTMMGVGLLTLAVAGRRRGRA